MIFKRANTKADDGKFKALKIASIAIFGLFALIYLSFLFILPNVIDINKFTPQIEAELKKQTKFGFELVNPKLQTTFRFGVKVKADKIALEYEDGSDFVDIEYPSIEINLPTLLFKRLNLDKIYAKNINVLLVYGKNKKYTVMDYIIEQPQETPREAVPELPVKIKNINIIVDNANLVLEDKNINKSFELKTGKTNLNLASLEGPVKIKTTGDIGVKNSDKNFVNFDINLFVKLPKMAAQPQKEEIKIEPFNPFENLDKFNFHSKILVDLKINDLENFDAKGYLKVSDATLTLNSLQLPKSFLNADFNGSEIKIDTNLYIAQNEFLNSKGKIKMGKNPKIDISAKTEKISLNNVLNLSEAVLDVFNINNDLKNITATGLITCDFNVKSDMKKIESSGNLKLRNGLILYKKMNIALTQIGSLLDFDNNKVAIKDTSANLNGAKFMVNGEILSNSKLDIKINSDPLKIAEIMKLGEALKIIRAKDFADFVFSGGLITISVDLKGDLQNISPRANVLIDKLAMTIKSLNLPLNISKIDVKVTPNKKDFDINILVSQVTGGFVDPKLALNIPAIKITGDSKVLNLPAFNATLEGTDAMVEGKISDYAVNPKLNFKANGSVAPATVLAFVPKESRSLVKYAGKMPFSGTLTGDLMNMSVTGSVESSPQNYISVVDIDDLKGQNNKLNLDINLKGDNLDINNIAINSKTAAVKGKISNISAKNPTINGLDINVPQKLNITAPAFDNIKLAVSTNLHVAGTALNPTITGNCVISNLKYPPLNLAVQNANVDFKKTLISVVSNGITLGKSDFTGDLTMSSDFSKIITINNIKFNSNYFDSDELMKIMSSMPNTQTTAGPEMPLVIKSGRGTIGKLKSGDVIVENIGFDFNMYNNLFKITNMTATAYDGKVTGDIDYNIAKLKADINCVGKNINVKKASKATMGMALPLSGTLDGMIKASFTGETYDQQMRTLNGLAKFDIKDGEMRNFIRFEHFLYAGNIVTQNLLGFNLNSVISAVTRVDTGQFKTLEATVTFANSWANIQEFKSSGPNMSLWANGKYNLLTNFADMTVLGRISPRVASVLGPLGNLSIDKILGKLPEKGLEILSVIKSVTPQNPLLMQVNTSDITKIPPLSVSTADNETKEFQVILNGPADSTRSVKSFKWITDKNITQPTSPTTSPATTNTLKETGTKVQETIQNKLQNVLPTQTQPVQPSALQTTQPAMPQVPENLQKLKDGLNILRNNLPGN